MFIITLTKILHMYLLETIDNILFFSLLDYPFEKIVYMSLV